MTETTWVPSFLDDGSGVQPPSRFSSAPFSLLAGNDLIAASSRPDTEAPATDFSTQDPTIMEPSHVGNPHLPGDMILRPGDGGPRCVPCLRRYSKEGPERAMYIEGSADAGCSLQHDRPCLSRVQQSRRALFPIAVF